MSQPKAERLSPDKSPQTSMHSTYRKTQNTRSITNLDRTITINNSKAHQRFSFGKDTRFKDPKIMIDVVQYDLPDTVKMKGATSQNK